MGTQMQYIGQIKAYENGFYRVEVSDAPPHLAIMFLRGQQIEQIDWNDRHVSLSLRSRQRSLVSGIVIRIESYISPCLW